LNEWPSKNALKRYFTHSNYCGFKTSAQPFKNRKVNFGKIRKCVGIGLWRHYYIRRAD
jgi:hypothetical protein